MKLVDESLNLFMGAVAAVLMLLGLVMWWLTRKEQKAAEADVLAAAIAGEPDVEISIAERWEGEWEKELQTIAAQVPAAWETPALFDFSKRDAHMQKRLRQLKAMVASGAFDDRDSGDCDPVL